mmetsp:Transcript_65586/g.129912  ORF Transcript_65586/g.129912 Transcript_65586/m.129912 type:complete len:112 (+) Transcript_65586:3177-3512(+)
MTELHPSLCPSISKHKLLSIICAHPRPRLDLAFSSAPTFTLNPKPTNLNCGVASYLNKEALQKEKERLQFESSIAKHNAERNKAIAQAILQMYAKRNKRPSLAMPSSALAA